jgi:hypothetical protein
MAKAMAQTAGQKFRSDQVSVMFDLVESGPQQRDFFT